MALSVNQPPCKASSPILEKNSSVNVALDLRAHNAQP
jgi:hypothetical protein